MPCPARARKGRTTRQIWKPGTGATTGGPGACSVRPASHPGPTWTHCARCPPPCARLCDMSPVRYNVHADNLVTEDEDTSSSHRNDMPIMHKAMCTAGRLHGLRQSLALPGMHNMARARAPQPHAASKSSGASTPRGNTSAHSDFSVMRGQMGCLEVKIVTICAGLPKGEAKQKQVLQDLVRNLTGQFREDRAVGQVTDGLSLPLGHTDSDQAHTLDACAASRVHAALHAHCLAEAEGACDTVERLQKRCRLAAASCTAWPRRSSRPRCGSWCDTSATRSCA